MADEPPKPATREDSIQAFPHGLQFEDRRRIRQADEFMARVAAEKLVDNLQRSNYVVMRAPPAPSHSSPRLRLRGRIGNGRAACRWSRGDDSEIAPPMSDLLRLADD